jgi:ribosomal-protein-alanine N-acetyltransferase
MSVLIRTMQLADLDAVLSIARDLPHAPQWSRTGYEAALETAQTGRRIALVAEVTPGQPAGYAILSLVPPEAELESIGVAPQFQRQGIARAMLDDIFVGCVAYGCTSLILEVRESNDAAQALYQAAGFQFVGRRPGYYSFPMEDALVLRRELVPAEK